MAERNTRPELRPVPVVASVDAAAQLVAARYIRSPLDPVAARDIKLVVFLLEADGGRLSTSFPASDIGVAYNERTAGHLASLSGISRERVSGAVTRLVEAGVLLVQDGADPRLVFSDRVLGPAGSREYVDWHSVLVRLRGQPPALIVLQAVLDSMRTPWDWMTLSYDELAGRSGYSLGMVRHGLDRLLTGGVLERRSHSGRSHEYRCASVFLHGVPTYLSAAPPVGEMPVVPAADRTIPPSPGARRVSARPTPAVSPGDSTHVRIGSLVVEIGGLVLRVPEGTVISMDLEADGTSVYAIGTDLKIRRERS